MHALHVAVACGDWETARKYEFPRRAYRHNEVEEIFSTLFAMGRLWLQLETGEEAAARGILEELLRTEEEIADDRLRVARRVALCRGMVLFDRVVGFGEHLDRVESWSEWALDNQDSSWSFRPLSSFLSLANVAVLRSDAKGASRLYQTVKNEFVRPMTFSEYPDHILGRLARTAGDIDLALDHLEKAHRFLKEGGWKPTCAWAGYDWAEALLARGSREDRAKAHELLAETQELAGSLGMTPLLSRCEDLLGKAASPTERKAYPDGLTEREVEVLRLVALGFTDNEVAEKLFISPKTASNHVSNILRKTHTANRTEAATYAAQTGMLDPEPESS